MSMTEPPALTERFTFFCSPKMAAAVRARGYIEEATPSYIIRRALAAYLSVEAEEEVDANPKTPELPFKP